MHTRTQSRKRSDMDQVQQAPSMGRVARVRRAIAELAISFVAIDMLQMLPSLSQYQRLK